MKILKIENNISLVEIDNKKYIRIQYENGCDWADEVDFNYETEEAKYFHVFTNHFENEYDIELQKLVRKLKLESL